MFTTGNKSYRKGLGHEEARALFGEGLLTADGETWKDHRKVMQPFFHSSKMGRLQQADRGCHQDRTCGLARRRDAQRLPRHERAVPQRHHAVVLRRRSAGCDRDRRASGHRAAEQPQDVDLQRRLVYVRRRSLRCVRRGRDRDVPLRSQGCQRSRQPPVGRARREPDDVDAQACARSGRHDDPGRFRDHGIGDHVDALSARTPPEGRRGCARSSTRSSTTRRSKISTRWTRRC